MGNVGNHPLNLGGDARNLYWFNSDVLDYVFSSHLLEDFEDTEGVLREWVRILKVGGYLVLFLPDEQIYREHCKKSGQEYNLSHKIGDFSLAYVRKILLDRFPDMEIVHENPLVDTYSFELVARKCTPSQQADDSLRNEMNQKDAQIGNLQATLSDIYHSRGWALLAAGRNLIYKLLPPGTRRRRGAGIIFRAVWGLLSPHRPRT